MTRLHRQILKTLTYFDTFDFPLTIVELHDWLWMETATLHEVMRAVECLVADRMIQGHDGFYCLSGRESIFLSRQSAVSILEHKFDIATKAAALLRHIPFVRAVYLCNTVAGSVATAESDIDVFIVLKSGRVWLARFLITVVLSIARLRRTKTQVRNRICLSFYIADDYLDLSVISLPGTDVYLAYWIHQLMPIFDPDQVLADVYTKNPWVWRLLPNAPRESQVHPRWVMVQGYVAAVAEVLLQGRVGHVLERWTKQMQQKKMRPRSVLPGSETHVVIHDRMLKFHEHDRRALFRNRWQERCWKKHIW